jgi:hypothetical protein
MPVAQSSPVISSSIISHVVKLSIRFEEETQLLQSLEWYERFGWTIEDYSVSFGETGAMLHLGEMCFPLQIA